MFFLKELQHQTLIIFSTTVKRGIQTHGYVTSGEKPNIPTDTLNHRGTRLFILIQKIPCKISPPDEAPIPGFQGQGPEAE